QLRRDLTLHIRVDLRDLRAGLHVTPQSGVGVAEGLDVHALPAKVNSLLRRAPLVEAPLEGVNRLRSLRVRRDQVSDTDPGLLKRPSNLGVVLLREVLEELVQRQLARLLRELPGHLVERVRE